MKQYLGFLGLSFGSLHSWQEGMWVFDPGEGTSQLLDPATMVSRISDHLGFHSFPSVIESHI